MHTILMSRVMRKPDFCQCKNKGPDQLCSDCTADQCLCFRYTDSMVPLLPKIRNFKLLAIFCTCTAWFVSSWLECEIVGFLTQRLNARLKTLFVVCLLLCFPRHFKFFIRLMAIKLGKSYSSCSSILISCSGNICE